MDTYRDHPTEFDFPADEVEADPAGVAVGTDERRMHVRAYNYWASLLDGRELPSIEDLEPGDLLDFSAHSVLLDFTAGRDNPAMPFVGEAIRAECDLAGDVQAIADVPSRSLLSRLTDHYMQIIANRAPVGFEAEFVNQRGDSICYRGIMMPFSSDGDTIDFIYGVINWKTVAGRAAADAPMAAALAAEALPLPVPDADVQAEQATADEPCGLADRLSAARESAEEARFADGRSRDALYRALARAYDFALAARDEPGAFADLLEDSGVKAQARAPMTAIARLVFGIDYDKSRLTEFAAALSHADRRQVAAGGFLDFIQGHSGGLKGLVAAERLERRPGPRDNGRAEKAREKMRSAEPLEIGGIATSDEFALVLTRRSSGGIHQAVAVVDDPALLERAIRKAGG